MRSPLRFLAPFLSSPAQTGAIAASSRALAQLAVDAANLHPGVSSVVELGSGTGVFTAAILRKIDHGAVFMAIEINPAFVRETRRNCPGATVYEGSALMVGEFLERHGLSQCDRIVCGLPWAVFSKHSQVALLAASYEALKPGGRFVTFAYLHGLALPQGLHFRRLLQQRFSYVTTTRTVWRNLPPAFVYCADK
jgi:phospholipid N-methyltransferase